ncbi:hypothetical protein T492DRAFT_601498 [Pavlovales sp. CCMP2436]|nr:hypothetical protein T492DRAFT_601498 [Pavlovales sp. CCMP2436]
MEAIRRIVSEIVFMCRLKSVAVSDTLAAFVAHAIVLEHVNLFPLDKELNESDVQDLVRMAVERLLTVDSASLETIKMQVAFDTAKLDEAEALDAMRAAREQRERMLLQDIIEARLKGGNDVEALTALYRRIFNFLVLRAGLEAGANRPAEREIAAALESVFPRIGLKAFTMLAAEDKAAQLNELANIVLGIRLFNRSIDKGGVGIADFPAIARARVKDFLNLTGAELENVGTLCDQYAEVLTFRHSGLRAEQVSEDRTRRLQEELANRRQFAAYVALLFDGLQQSAKHVAELERLYDKEMDSLKQSVGARSSVPKEQEQVRFKGLLCVAISCVALCCLIVLLECVTTLSSDTVLGVGASVGAGQAGAEAEVGGEGEAETETEDVAERIAADFAPSMLQLSLELEGFCPVTLVDKNGLLLPGSPDRIVKYRRRYYACLDDDACEAFVSAPAKYVQGALAQATRSPELITLLRLQEHFPGNSITEVMRQARARRPPAQDAQIQTQTHLVDKHIDPSYEFSEWALRRRALLLVDLRQKATKGQQTTATHFRKDSTTQVFLFLFLVLSTSPDLQSEGVRA